MAKNPARITLINGSMSAIACSQKLTAQGDCHFSLTNKLSANAIVTCPVPPIYG